MKLIRLIIICLICLGIVSCEHNVQNKKFVIPYVSSILSDTTSIEYQILKGGEERIEKGSIAIVGKAHDVIRITESMLVYDKHDNVSGKERPDGLPDFSGETFVSIYDLANEPYDDYLVMGNEEFLKELNVRNFLAASDTISYKNLISLDQSYHKQRSKIVIYASSYASAYGYSEADTLCKASSSELAVFAPIQAMVHHACTHLKGEVNLAIWSDNKKIDKGIYSSVIPSILKGYDGIDAEYQALVSYEDSSETEVGIKEKLLSFLDMYIDATDGKMLSAILIDNDSVPVKKLQAVIDELKTTEDSELMMYRTLLKNDFMLIDAGEALAEQCYNYMRQANVFTHKIAYPDMKCYFTSALPDLTGADYEDTGEFTYSTKYGRATNQEQPTFAIVELKEKYFPTSLMHFMEAEAPKSYSIYVR